MRRTDRGRSLQYQLVRHSSAPVYNVRLLLLMLTARRSAACRCSAPASAPTPCSPNSRCRAATWRRSNTAAVGAASCCSATSAESLQGGRWGSGDDRTHVGSCGWSGQPTVPPLGQCRCCRLCRGTWGGCPACVVDACCTRTHAQHGGRGSSTGCGSASDRPTLTSGRRVLRSCSPLRPAARGSCAGPAAHGARGAWLQVGLLLLLLLRACACVTVCTRSIATPQASALEAPLQPAERPP